MAASDFQLGLYTLLKGLQSGVAGYDDARDYKLKLRRQQLDEAKDTRQAGLDERRMATDERRQRVSEFTDLGTDIDTLARGERVAANPYLMESPKPNSAGITVGQEPYQERFDFSQRQDYLARLKQKNAPRTPTDTTDDVLSSMTKELDSLNNSVSLSPDQEKRKAWLEDQIDLKRGLKPRPREAAGQEPPPEPQKPGWGATLKSAARSGAAAIFGSGSRPRSPLDDVEAAIQKKKGKKPAAAPKPTRPPYVRER